MNLEPFEGKLTVKEIALQAFDCLKKLHKTLHLHRDVKPDNFMISLGDNKVRIIDFGLVINYKPDGENHRPLGRYSF